MAVCPKPAESRTCLSGLPAEILVSIAECCRARTVLSLIGTCWRLHGILNNGHVWKQVLRSQHWQRWGPSSRFDLTKLSHAIRAASESHTAPPADFLATKLWARYALADDDAWVVLGKADQDLEAALRSLVRIAMPLAVFGHPITSRAEALRPVAAEVATKNGYDIQLNYLYTVFSLDQTALRSQPPASPPLQSFRRGRRYRGLQEFVRSAGSATYFSRPVVEPLHYSRMLQQDWAGISDGLQRQLAFADFASFMRFFMMVWGLARGSASVADSLLARDPVQFPRPPSAGDAFRSSGHLASYVCDLDFERLCGRCVKDIVATIDEGVWVGYYQGHGFGNFDPPMTEIRFAKLVAGEDNKHHISATGTDSVSDFTLTGTMDSTGEMDMVKQYINSHNWKLVARMTPWGIFGAWGSVMGPFGGGVLGAFWMFRSEWVREWSESDMPLPTELPKGEQLAE